MPISSVVEPFCLVTATRYRGADSLSESLVENRHLGWAVVANSQQNLLYCTPEAEQIATFFRSAAKPFQAMSLIQRGLADELTIEELALCCASHTASARHLKVVARLLSKAGLSEAALQCGAHEPLDIETQAILRQTGQAARAIHNNCSGKHAGMLLYCKRQGLDPATYLDPAHPLQQAILADLRQRTGIADIPVAVDGCGAPVFYLPLVAMAGLYAQLGTDTACALICKAMMSYPELVGGSGRVDTVIMQASGGKLLAKVGADGVLCVSRAGCDEGLAIKIADGSTEIRNLVAVEILIRLGWLDAAMATDSRLQPYRMLQRVNTQGRVIGDYQIHFDVREARV